MQPWDQLLFSSFATILPGGGDTPPRGTRCVCTRGKIAAAASHLQALSLKRMNKKMVDSDSGW